MIDSWIENNLKHGLFSDDEYDIDLNDDGFSSFEDDEVMYSKHRKLCNIDDCIEW